MKRFLITTALEETWSDREPVVFLGEWCRLFSRQERWSAMDADVLPYHWDARAKLFGDYQYLQGLHERLLEELAAQLNRIHGVDHGLRYWRILIGPWLGCFIPMLFDRWCSVRRAIERYELSGTVVLKGPGEAMVPNDMAGFLRVFTGDDWNHQLFSAILRWASEVPITQLEWAGGPELNPLPVPGWKQRQKRRLASGYSRVAGLFARDHDAFLLATYLPPLDEMRMYRRLGQLPQLWRSVPPIQVPVDSSQRDWSVDGVSRSDFESLARFLVPRHMPSAYLEGYVELVEQARALPWPKRPSLIWTSNSDNSDDVFKSWAAEKVEQGSRLVLAQHGGHYGIGRWSFLEAHELAVSDCFLSWGWSEPEEPKIKPVGQLKRKRPLRIQHGKQSGALLVTCALPRVSYWMYSVYVSRQYMDYFDDQCAFVSALPPTIRHQLTVRLYPIDWGWNQVGRWRDRFPELRLDEGRSDMNVLIRGSRIYIATYNATTFLESFTMNVPTVIFWNPNHWELRDSAVPYFEDLKRIGVFHETPESAARHVAAVWDEVDSWWNSPDVLEVLKRFKERYCYLSHDLLDRVEHALRDVMAGSDDAAVR